ncbi:HAD hydrolase-like protein, partial [Candidatus Woesearchaeota archaeon]|nr:HAD hydrolase-like protein [Candidatus Woesearchaeota archaeon]
MKEKKQYTVLSFDLDGTLIDDSRFGGVFWYEEVPRLYAQQYHISVEDAKLIVLNSYKLVGHFDRNWYRPHFWFERFKLQEDWRKVIHDLHRDIRVFPDVKPALQELKNKHKLIIITHSTREFVQLKIQVESIK